MRFRNYVNRYNQRNRIFSEDDIWNMRLANIFDNEPAIMAQHKDIGIPSYDELSASDNTEWVEPFINRDGVEDGGYWQSFLPEKKKDGFKTVYIPERPYPVEIDDGVYDPSEEEIPAPNDEEETGGIENTGKNVDNTPTLEGKVEYDIDIRDLPDYSKSKTVENKTQTTSGEKSAAPKEEDWKNDPRLGSRLDKYEKLLNSADKVMPVMSNVRYYRASKDFVNNKKVNDFERENAVTNLMM